jgi:hypothetical protein
MSAVKRESEIAPGTAGNPHKKIAPSSVRFVREAQQMKGLAH